MLEFTFKGAVAHGDYFFPKKFEFVSLCSFICDRFWENPYKRGKYHYSISSVLVISLIFVKIFFIMKMDVWNIVLGPGKDIRSGTHYNSRSKPNTVLKFLTSRAASIRKTGTRP